MDVRNYDELRPDLKTGDLVLTTGRGPVSAAIRWATRSAWSHVGMIVRAQEWDTVLLWEATTLGAAYDVEQGRPVKGVRLVPLSHRVGAPGQTMAVRQLRGVLLETRDVVALSDLRKALNGRPYEQNELELLRSAWDGPLGANREDLSSVFCSELVAEAYQALRLLPDSIPSNEYVPGDFGEGSTSGVELTRGYLGPEIAVLP